MEAMKWMYLYLRTIMIFEKEEFEQFDRQLSNDFL